MSFGKLATGFPVCAALALFMHTAFFHGGHVTVSKAEEFVRAFLASRQLARLVNREQVIAQ